jgi:membrane protein implicated in regulation of membrane protease activity
MEQIIFWLILLVVLVAVEAFTLGLTTIWFAGGALVGMLAAMLGAPLPVQMVLFFIVSLVLVFFTRPVAVRYFNKDRVRTNAESLVGKQAIVISEIDNLQAIGQVTVAGQEWSARSWEENGKFPVGAVVRVASINGVKLIVKEIPAEEVIIAGSDRGDGTDALQNEEVIPHAPRHPVFEAPVQEDEPADTSNQEETGSELEPVEETALANESETVPA